MALTVEDGTLIADANTYINEADADTYFTAHGSPSAWTAATTAAKEAALLYAATHLDHAYDWTGDVVSLTQTMAWPRAGAEDDEERRPTQSDIPQGVIDAQCELALAHIANALNATFERGGQIQRQRAGSVEIEYSPGASMEPSMPHVTRLLGGFGAVVGLGSAEIERG